jgi:NhaP-type Na+/H+ or K+/H+ antiporter
VFAYLGVSSIYYLFSQPICWTFLVAEIVIVIVGRFLAVFLSYYFFQMFPGSPQNKMTVNQLAFLTFAALIRGSIAFGLILKMDNDFNESVLGFTVFT